MAPTILPTRQHFDVVCHETSKHIFAEALKEDPYQGNGIVLIQPLVNIPVQTLYKVLDCALHIFFGVVFPFMCEGKTAVYFITCAVVLDPLQCAAQIVSQIVRIAASLLGIVSTTASLYGWWFAEVIELTALQGFTALYDRLQVIALHGWWCAEVIELTALAACTGLYSVLNFQPSGRPLLDQDIEPKNAVEFFGVVNSRKYALRDNNARLSPVEPVKNMVLELWKGHRELATELLFNTTEGVPSRTQDILQTKITKQEQEGEGQDPVLTIADISAYEATLLYNHLATRTAHRDEIRTQFEKRSGPVFLAGRAAWRALKSWNDFGTASHYQ